MTRVHRWKVRRAVLLAVLVAVGGFASSASASAACRNPDWAPTPLTHFTIESCTAPAWSTLTVNLPAGDKTLEGMVSTVTYVHTEGAPAASAQAVRDYQITQAVHAGAKRVSDPEAPFQAVLTRRGEHGEVWSIYDHGSGNDEETDGYTLTTVVIAPPKQEVVARQPKGSLLDAQGKACADPSWLARQFDYFKLRDCTRADYDSLSVELPGGSKAIAGHLLEVNYELTDPKKDPSAIYVWRNYVTAIEKLGAKLVSDPTQTYEAVLTEPTPEGEYWFIYKHGSGNEQSTTTFSLVTLQVGGPAPKRCTLEVYGVHFDFNKATLKPESTPVLNQLLDLFKADAAYRAEIGGHTDDVGTAAYNLTLSDERAQAVKAWLVAHGVGATRLTTHGYGDTRPLVPNTTDANRAKNRRVELKKPNCRG